MPLFPYLFRSADSLFVALPSAILGLEAPLLGAPAWGAAQEASRAEAATEGELALAAAVLGSLATSPGEVAVPDRNAEEEAQGGQDSSAKESSNDVEQQPPDASSPPLSSDVPKSDDQKNLDSSDNFSAFSIEQRTTTSIRA